MVYSELFKSFLRNDIFYYFTKSRRRLSMIKSRWDTAAELSLYML